MEVTTSGVMDLMKEISTGPSIAQDTEDSESKQLTTVIVFVISAILAIALLFVIAVFIDCRQEKLQKLNSKVKPKRKLKLKLPLPIVGRALREDQNSILDKMHVGECSGSLA
ncbi:unnamed protein product [Phyllotreta striolata]|uniref:Uncharacterized protein n=1 Tax=Phyllotreta striolata TaxID=444603 RepID=A0A9N9XQP2_PHYSR|nr:unnamed protein product [Phyllotreta striolata]